MLDKERIGQPSVVNIFLFVRPLLIENPIVYNYFAHNSVGFFVSIHSANFFMDSLRQIRFSCKKPNSSMHFLLSRIFIAAVILSRPWKSTSVHRTLHCHSLLPTDPLRSSVQKRRSYPLPGVSEQMEVTFQMALIFILSWP